MTGKIPPRSSHPARRIGRRPGLAAASLVSLATALGWTGEALADTTISSARTTPISTSTANSGAPDNVVITSDGSVKPASGVAVTLDSDNTVSNAGTIQIQDQNDSTGVLALGGHTGSITNSGTITVNETTTNTDTNGDGNLDGPFATGARRFGVRVTGSQPLDGAIANSGTITVRGDDSAGVSLEAALTGALTNSGTIAVTGSRTFGIRTGAVGGDVTVSGAVSAAGESAEAIHIGGDLGGGLVVQSAVTATGYRYPTRSTDTSFLSKLGADDLLQGGPAISVAGSVGRGVLIDTAGSVASSSAAPGVLVGAVGRDVALANLGTGADAYGLEIKGAVSGLGVYDHVSATGLQLGVAGGGAVTTGGGVHLSGALTATSYLADATAMVLNPGASAPLIQNDGATGAGITASGGTYAAHGLLINAGAKVPAFANSSSLTAAISGSATGQAIALQDLSGTLTSIQNIRTIAASITPSDGSAVTGQAIAIDVSANTSGVSLLQYDASSGATPPVITGAVLFGSGSDLADIQAGTVTGDLAFGAGANTLAISGGAKVTGAVTADGGTLGLSIASGALQIDSANRLNLTSLNLGAQSSLILTVDPASGTNTTLDVAGAATVADGAKLGLRFISLLQGTATYTLIHATRLSAGVIDTSLLGSMPWLYTASVAADQTQGAVDATIALKTASQVGLSAAAAPAYAPVLQAIDRETGLRNAFLAQTDKAGFTAAFDQLLPSRSSAIFQLTTAEAEAVGRAIDDRQGSAGGAWLQELNYGASDKTRDGIAGYHAWGVGLVGGYELALAPTVILGVTVGASSGQVRELAYSDTGKLTVESFQGGVYWRGALGRFSADARVGGGYLTMKSERAIAIANISSATFAATADSSWSGWSTNARLHAAYEADLGALYLRPQAGFDYARLSEDGHAETGGGDGVDLVLQSRESTRASAFAGIAIGATFGDDATWGPELTLGYRDVASEKLGDTTARFASGGDSFTIPAAEIGGQGFAARLAFKGENGYGGFAVEGGGEMRDGLAVYDLRLTAHLQF